MSKTFKHYGNIFIIAAATVVFVILSLTGNLKGSTEILLEKVAMNMILAVSLGLVVGFLGELSLGHAGFMCLGAYLGGKFSVIVCDFMKTQYGIADKNNYIALIVSLIVGGLVAAFFGFIIGLPALRLRGDYLAIVTLAFCEIVRVIFRQSKNFGENLGLSTPRFDREVFFIVAFVLVIITLFIIQNLMKSKHGRAITSIRDNEIAARATGINVTKYKLVAFIVSSFFAGIAGVMFSYTNSKVLPTKFDYNYSIEILVMVVLGGMGNINGSLVAATLITILNEKLPTVLPGDKAVLKNLLYALVLIVIVVYRNAPALKNFRERYNLKKLFEKFRNHNPAKVREDEAKWDRVPTKIDMNEVLSVDVQPQTSTADPDKREDK